MKRKITIINALTCFFSPFFSSSFKTIENVLQAFKHFTIFFCFRCLLLNVIIWRLLKIYLKKYIIERWSLFTYDFYFINLFSFFFLFANDSKSEAMIKFVKQKSQ